MKKFLKNLEEELRKNNLSDTEIEDILADHEEMIETAINEGLNADDLEKKFGNPRDLAQELSQFSEKKGKGRERKEMKTKEFNEVLEGYSIDISLINEDLEFKFEEENKIVVNYKGTRDFEDYEIRFEGNVFTLEYQKKEKRSFFTTRNSGEFLIILPKKLKVDSFKLKGINGDIELPELNANSFTLETTNGDCQLENITVDKFRLNTINGDLNIENIKVEYCVASQISGDLSMKNVVVEDEFSTHTVSGDISIENATCGDFTLKTVSGDVEGKEFYPKTITLKSVSGDIDIKNSDSSRTIKILDKKSVSGRIRIKNNE